jgi:YidC/Oxa1 family membrane protein insertase
LANPDKILIPGIIGISILPVLMGASMYIQQKMTAVSDDPQQKMFLYIMPVMFTFIFWNFPSGLVLYWLTNNILSIIIQYIVLKKEPTS